MSRALDRRAALIAALGALPLAGCSHLPWLGANDKPKLPGVRKPVLLLEDDVKADPALAATPVTLPPARRNEDWPQAGGSVSHCLQHVSLADSIREAWRASIGAGSARRQRLTAAPVEAGGRVFAVDTRDEVSAFVAQSGQRAWRFQSKDAKRGERMTTGGLGLRPGPRLRHRQQRRRAGDRRRHRGGAVAARRDGADRARAAAVTGGRVLVITADNQLFALELEDRRAAGWRHAGVFEQAGILGGATAGLARRDRDRRLLVGRGVRARARDGRAALVRHRAAAAPDARGRHDQRHRRRPGDRPRPGLRRGRARRDGGARPPARRPDSGPRA